MYLSVNADVLPEIRCEYRGYKLEKLVTHDILEIKRSDKLFKFKIGRCRSRDFVEIDDTLYIMGSNSIVYYSKHNKGWSQKFFNVTTNNSFFLADSEKFAAQDIIFLGVSQGTFTFFKDGFLFLTAEDIDDNIQNEITVRYIFKVNSILSIEWDKCLHYKLSPTASRTYLNSANFIDMQLYTTEHEFIRLRLMFLVLLHEQFTKNMSPWAINFQCARYPDELIFELNQAVYNVNTNLRFLYLTPTQIPILYSGTGNNPIMGILPIHSETKYLLPTHHKSWIFSVLLCFNRVHNRTYNRYLFDKYILPLVVFVPPPAINKSWCVVC